MRWIDNLRPSRSRVLSSTRRHHGGISLLGHERISDPARPLGDPLRPQLRIGRHRHIRVADDLGLHRGSFRGEHAGWIGEWAISVRPCYRIAVVHRWMQRIIRDRLLRVMGNPRTTSVAPEAVTRKAGGLARHEIACRHPARPNAQQNCEYQGASHHRTHRRYPVCTSLGQSSQIPPARHQSLFDGWHWLPAQPPSGTGC